MVTSLRSMEALPEEVDIGSVEEVELDEVVLDDVQVADEVDDDHDGGVESVSRQPRTEDRLSLDDELPEGKEAGGGGGGIKGGSGMTGGEGGLGGVPALAVTSKIPSSGCERLMRLAS